jgi:hypothetical protein
MAEFTQTCRTNTGRKTSILCRLFTARNVKKYGGPLQVRSLFYIIIIVTIIISLVTGLFFLVILLNQQ